MTRRLIDLSMEVYQGMMTYPNVAQPVIVEMESYRDMARSVGTDPRAVPFVHRERAAREMAGRLRCPGPGRGDRQRTHSVKPTRAVREMPSWRIE